MVDDSISLKENLYNLFFNTGSILAGETDTLLNEEFKEKCSKYSYHAPYTKESLLYREIFESFYPNMDKLIVDYWLPNQSWPGCQINDPSARYLSNYGKSGE